MIRLFIIYCLFFFMMPIFIYGQSFQISENDIHIRGKVGQKLETPLTLKNLTDGTLSLVIERTENNIANSQASFMCWDKDCAENTSLHKKIEARKSTNQLLVTFEAGLSGGYSSVRYTIFNRNNPQDALDLVIHYNIEEPSYNNDIYSTEKIKIKEVYPNPVSNFLYVDYQIQDIDANAKIGIHNVLGNIVEEFQLEPMEKKAKINTTQLNPGVYFYSLSVDNETVLIKKFVVRK